MFKEKFRSSTVVLSSDKKIETGKLKIHFLTSKYAYSFFGRALSHEKPVCVETEVFTLLTNSDVLRLRMKEGQNIESAQPLPPQPLMVRFLWLLLKEGKHVKGVQEVKLYNSDCKLYVLLKQCLPSRSLFNLIIFPKDRSIRHVDTRNTSQNRLCYMFDKNNKLRRKEYLLRNILKSFVIGLTIIFFEALTAATYVQEFIW